MKKMHEPMRAFFAIDPPEIIRQSLSELIHQLQHLYARAPIHWVRPDHLHITLQFMATLAEHDIHTLIESAKHELKLAKSFAVTLNEIELFPTLYKPRIVSIKVEPQPLLAELAKSLGKVIHSAGYPIEQRPYRGHLTLGRIRETRHPITLESYQHPPIPAFRANTIILYRSEPTHAGSNYYPLEKIHLAG